MTAAGAGASVTFGARERPVVGASDGDTIAVALAVVLRELRCARALMFDSALRAVDRLVATEVAGVDRVGRVDPGAGVAAAVALGVRATVARAGTRAGEPAAARRAEDRAWGVREVVTGLDRLAESRDSLVGAAGGIHRTH